MMWMLKTERTREEEEDEEEEEEEEEGHASICLLSFLKKS
jgi:hypothetical protein